MCDAFKAVTAADDYGRAEPYVIRETPYWAAVYKPPRLPTAPLRAEERNTLVYWFLHTRFTGQPALSGGGQGDTLSAERSRAAQVRGRKAIEAGLMHRLDTETRGVVLFAKDQQTYDFLFAQQQTGRIIKTYYAFVEPDLNTASGISDSAVLSDIDILSGFTPPYERETVSLPYTVVSQFRNFGPGAKRVAPVFSGSRHYKRDGRLYTTVVETVTVLPGPKAPLIRVRCRLAQGYRHQIRAHLASLGMPIVGDPLYRLQKNGTASRSNALLHRDAPPVSEPRSLSSTAPLPDPDLCAVRGLQLYAAGLSFPDPENPRRNICVALPPPDKMNP